MTLCDAIVVSYNSHEVVRRCVAPLAARPEVRVIVVDNASLDGTLDALDGAPVVTLARPRNEGFARACNIGWRTSDAPFVLLLNPDAVLTWSALRVLIRALEDHPEVAVVGPRLERADGTLELSQHRFPRLSTTYGQALFLHRLLRRARFEDDVRNALAYARPQSPDWLSGACLLIRRPVLEALGGLDERFFLYREDVDLCRRVRDRGLTVRYEPRAVALHDGGGSSRADVTLPLYAASRTLYARKHRSRLGALLERLGLGLSAATHAVASRGTGARIGHARSLPVVVRPSGESGAARARGGFSFV
jgi:N-acetylglucosaminyl-diphospho-decaprenol L-rhamnosyltransferase